MRRLTIKPLYHIKIICSVSVTLWIIISITQRKDSTNDTHHITPSTAKLWKHYEGFSYCNLNPSKAYPKHVLDQQPIGLFQNVTGLELYVYSAFVISKTKLPPYVAVLAAGNLNEQNEVFCQILMPNGRIIASKCEYSVLTPAAEGYGSYMSYYIKCPHPLKTGIILLAITNTLCGNPGNSLDIHFPKFAKPVEESRIAICHPPLRNIESPYAMVEWLEFQKQMGVTRVIFNGVFNVSKSVAKVINHYRYHEKKLVNLRAWGVRNQDPRFDSPALDAISANDCLYRNAGKYAYFIFIRAGEFIVPKGDKLTSYNSLIQLLIHDYGEMVSNFVLQYAHFCSDSDFGDDIRPLLLTMSHLSSAKTPLGLSTSIINTHAVISMLSRHPANVDSQYHVNLTVSRKMALVHKYKPMNVAASWKFPKSPCTVADSSALRFQKLLVKHVNNVLKTLSLRVLGHV